MKIKASCKMDGNTVTTMAYMEIYGTQKPIRRLILRTALFVVLMLLIALEVWLLGWNLPVILLLALLLAAGGMEYWWYFVTPKRRFRALGKNQNKERHYVFSDSTFCVDEHLTVEYDTLYRVAETKEYLALFRSRKKVLMVEKKTITGGSAERLCQKLQDILDNRYIICKD